MGANYLTAEEQRAQGVNSSTSTTSGWQTIVLTNSTNVISGASLSTNTFTLPAGTYFVMGRMPVRGTGGNTGLTKFAVRLQNTSDATTIMTGTAAQSDSNMDSVGALNMFVTMSASIMGIFTLAGTKSVQFQARTQNGTYVANNVTGDVEVYGQITFWKIA